MPASDDEFVVTNSSPILQVATSGPRKLMVGKSAFYKVSIHNSADVPAEGLTVTVNVPVWAEVLSRRATTGDAQEAFDSHGAMQWNIPVLAARRREELTLEIVARDFPFRVHGLVAIGAMTAMLGVLLNLLLGLSRVLLAMGRPACSAMKSSQFSGMVSAMRRKKSRVR